MISYTNNICESSSGILHRFCNIRVILQGTKRASVSVRVYLVIMYEWLASVLIARCKPSVLHKSAANSYEACWLFSLPCMKLFTALKRDSPAQEEEPTATGQPACPLAPEAKDHSLTRADFWKPTIPALKLWPFCFVPPQLTHKSPLTQNWLT